MTSRIPSRIFLEILRFDKPSITTYIQRVLSAMDGGHMTTVHLRKWKSFAPKIATIIKKYPPSQILYRGQADARWRLKTTLERYPVKLSQAKGYFRAMLSARPQIETYTNQSWSVQLVTSYSGGSVPGRMIRL